MSPAQAPPHRARVVLALSLVLPMAALLAACGRGGAAAPGGGMPPAPVAVVRVEPADLPAVYEYVGQAAGAREVEVRSRVAGILLKRQFREGATVVRGQSLYSIDAAPYTAVANRAEADVASAEARLAQATRTLGRLRPLHEARAVSQKEFDDAASAEQIARADLKGAQARLAEARLNVAYTRVEAPIGGVVGRSLPSEGTLVSGPDLLMTTITQTDPMLLRFGIADTDQLRWQAQAQAGQLALPKDGAFTVEVGLADGRTLARRGRLLYTDARVSTSTGTLEAQAEIANPDGALKPGQFVRVRLLGALRTQALKVPVRAVLDGPQGKFVYVVADAKAQVKPVQVGEQVADQWILTAGLQAGDTVIVDGFARIGPGAPVQVTPVSAAASGATPSKK